MTTLAIICLNLVINPPMLSEHFTEAELIRSSTAKRYQINNSLPNDRVRKNIRALIMEILEPLRMMLEIPISITSGYRCPRLNRMVGGARYSSHLARNYQAAADIQVGSVMNIHRAFRLLCLSDLPFDQIIYEKYPRRNGGYSIWIHISHKRIGRNRHQCLYKTPPVRGYNTVTEWWKKKYLKE